MCEDTKIDTNITNIMYMRYEYNVHAILMCVYIYVRACACGHACMHASYVCIVSNVCVCVCIICISYQTY